MLRVQYVKVAYLSNWSLTEIFQPDIGHKMNNIHTQVLKLEQLQIPCNPLCGFDGKLFKCPKELTQEVVLMHCIGIFSFTLGPFVTVYSSDLLCL